MTKIALLSSDYDMSQIAPYIRQADPELEVLMYGEPGADQAEIAACWNPPHGALAKMPNLKLIHAIAAGVDNILADPELPSLPVCRVVDPSHARGMGEFVTWSVLFYYRQLDLAMANQRKGVWFRPLQLEPKHCKIGIMGLGQIGSRVAKDLQRFGFPVRGWSKGEQTVDGVDMFIGNEQFQDFLADCDILICLLPLTAETKGLLNARTFSLLPKGAKLIHVGRGEHLMIDDLCEALASGQLGGAHVDVFEKEPLPPGSKLWSVPNLFITPHMASVAQSETIGLQIAENIQRLSRAEPLANVVDVSRGY